ncbi:MAG: ArnT family glycosyltransferase [Candidatus Thorarchaeota archaeon]
MSELIHSPQLSLIKIALLVVTGINILFIIVLRIVGSQMYPFYFIYYSWTVVYILFLVLIVLLFKQSDLLIIKTPPGIFAVMVLTASLRLLFLGQTEYISLDPLWYLDFGKFMQAGQIPYFQFYFPYPPLFAYFIFGIIYLAPSVDSFRIIAALFDAGIIPLLYYFVKNRTDAKWGSLIVFLYAFLPISIIESGWNGHFEPMANFLMLLAICLMIRKQAILSGISLGLAVATKIYPVFLLFVLIFMIDGKSNKLRLILSTGVSTSVTFIPLLMLSSLFHSPQSTSIAGSTSLIDSLLVQFLNPVFPTFLLTLATVTGILLGLALIIKEGVSNGSMGRAQTYGVVAILYGVIVLAMGIIALTYPLLPFSQIAYWRYPVDLAIIRGITSIICSAGVFQIGFERIKQKNLNVTKTELLLLIASLILLLSALSRDVFYGWYLLWTIVLILISRDRRLVLVILVCLLFIYPSYTHDNFSDFGYNESRYWEEEFDSVDGWTPLIHPDGDTSLTENITYGVLPVHGIARFWINCSGVSGNSLLDNVSISYQKNITFSYSYHTQFQTKVRASWDPTFGQRCELSLEYNANDEYDRQVNGSIINRSGFFTNLTYIPWRYSFSLHMAGYAEATTQNLIFRFFPKHSSFFYYDIEYLYTTNNEILWPSYSLIVPLLITLPLLGGFCLRNVTAVIENHKNLE